ncbi:MAG: hypothetical protein ACI9A8_002287, partial [Cryomorphaceae bacterium]
EKPPTESEVSASSATILFILIDLNGLNLKPRIKVFILG